MKDFYAHSLVGRGKEHWQPLESHLNLVAKRADASAAKFGATDWGHALGLLHDVGKYSVAFQARLDGNETRVDHSSAGAQLATELYGPGIGRVLGYAVAGHHGGMPNGAGSDGRSTLEERLEKPVANYANWRGRISLPEKPAAPRHRLHPTSKIAKERIGFQCSVLTRMLFSCLVDADFLDTEAFYENAKGHVVDRGNFTTISQLKASLDHYLAVMSATAMSAAPSTFNVNAARADVLAAARASALLDPGPFSMTVPTGGGKTLSSLAFALDHAVRHKLDRVIYVIPFTSIIEQTAAVFRAALAPHELSIVEHHSAFSDDSIYRMMERRGNAERGPQAAEKLRLATENWDAPIIVTTAVQFFESLFAARPSRCRKLHNIANSIVILDEAQTMPLHLLRPAIAMLDELGRNYKTTVVMCTATQPAVIDTGGADRSFEGGLVNVREIAPEPRLLYEKLRRVRVERIANPLDDAALAVRISQHEQCLVIVGTRKHARELFRRLPAISSTYHLTALMCPKHRSERLAEVRAALLANRPCILVSTTLIEAGVDVDFPVVYRASAGLDAIAQAAGRCNREGKRSRDESVVYVFEPADHKTIRELRKFEEMGRETLRRHAADPLSLDAIDDYFRGVYWRATEDGLDAKGILAALNLRAEEVLLPFEDVARAFQMIESDMQPILAPYDGKARDLMAELERSDCDLRQVARELQSYIVNVTKDALFALTKADALSPINPARFENQFMRLTDEAYERQYHGSVGLDSDNPTFRAAKSNIF